MNYVSFPGFGIDSIKLDPVAFNIFGISVMWYGVIITCGMLLAYLYGLTRAKIEKVKSDDITDLTLFLVIFGVIGARLYYIIFKLDEFIIRGADGSVSVGETLKTMVNLRSGGLAIYGGIIAGFITAIIVARVKRIRFPVLADIVAPCLLIGQSIGRWGNFMNVEAYGSPTELPWRMGVGSGGGAPFVHPTFLYESLWNLVGFVLIAIFYKKKKFHGQVFLFYGIWYGVGRAWIEGLRTDSLMLGPFRVSQILSIVIVVVFAVLMAIGMAKAPRVVRESADDTDSAGEADGEKETDEEAADDKKEETASENENAETADASAVEDAESVETDESAESSETEEAEKDETEETEIAESEETEETEKTENGEDN